jgi:hypothetical protein
MPDQNTDHENPLIPLQNIPDDIDCYVNAFFKNHKLPAIISTSKPKRRNILQRFFDWLFGYWGKEKVKGREIPPPQPPLEDKK